MNDQENAIIKEKKFEFWLGLVFLIPPILGVVTFVMYFLGLDSNFYGKPYKAWSRGSGGMSAVPIYLGIMAIVGAYLVKNNARYVFTNRNTKSLKFGNRKE